MAISVLVDWLSAQQGVSSLVAALVLAVGLTAFNQVQARRKRVLSFRVRFNSPLGFSPAYARLVARVMDQENTHIAEPALVVARVKNVGRTAISRRDYKTLELQFPQRRTIAAGLTEAKPEALSREFDSFTWQLGRSSLELPRVDLNPNEEYKVVVLLSNEGAGQNPPAKAIGRLSEGGLVTQADTPRTRRTTIVGAAVSTLLAGALVTTLLFAGSEKKAGTTAGAPVCASGELTVEGSSAFAGIAAHLAEQYMTYCDDAKITVVAAGSFEGLDHLQNIAPEQRPRRLALADGKFIGFTDLVPSRGLAVVPYSVVVNNGVAVSDIPAGALARIFRGEVADWRDVAASVDSAPIRVVARDDRSGSRRALETYVLKGRQAGATSDSCDVLREGVARSQPIICEQTTTSDVLVKVRTRPGAVGYVDTPNALLTPGVKQVRIGGQAATIDDIRAGYPFWTVEYLYSYGDLDRTDPLTRSFANYLVAAEARSMIAAQQYAPCVRTDGTPEPLCTTPRD
ncbi:PstS family phosphate ABC transporter substrate-binding protein [Actinoplanes teichomyceticus]|uniref:Phosphate ABC transporter substrate-binding protein (PhoT family) n=1 Tax=Actinoplanes teichomyceticus TaxID=1867 RepID=A0A561VH49_ACTTI|nr:substrate-binding domain-containing protein [Actinoplanes teichomyceticus]TWG10884.1 phosphate ABC transporter substrate-binding protein (PhoT family) [Actinoplanes teichomyceticus]GIF12495.1 phosphate ABC transporter substrate-binding protein [Actinoplanes teichomyceticus]